MTFKRKGESDPFSQSQRQGDATERPDFSALESDAASFESGFSIGDAANEIEAEVEPREVVGAAEPREVVRPSYEKVEEEVAPKKRYYSPGEVMKKKGCIGCGGMALSVPLMLMLLAALVVIL